MTAVNGSKNRNRPTTGQVSANQVHGFMLEPDKEMFYQTGYALHSYTLRSEDTGWLMIIRVNAQQGGRLVTFIKSGTIFDCWEIWYTAMTSNSIALKWYPDKFT